MNAVFQRNITEAEQVSLLLQEQVLPVNDAAALLSKGGGQKPSKLTVWRWVTKGVRVKGMGMVRLETFRVGGRRYTSVEAIGRFAAAQCEREMAPRIFVLRRPRRIREAAVAKAKKTLIAEGFMEPPAEEAPNAPAEEA